MPFEFNFFFLLSNCFCEMGSCVISQTSSLQFSLFAVTDSRSNKWNSFPNTVTVSLYVHVHPTSQLLPVSTQIKHVFALSLIISEHLQSLQPAFAFQRCTTAKKRSHCYCTSFNVLHLKEWFLSFCGSLLFFCSTQSIPNGLGKIGIFGSITLLFTPIRRRKVVSGFGLGLVASLIVLSVVFFDVSFKPRFLDPVLQGFNSFRSHNSSSIFLWSFSFPSTSSFSSSFRNASSFNHTSTKKLEDSAIIRERYEENASEDGKNRKFPDSGRMEVGLEDAHLGEFSEMVKNRTFSLGAGRVPEKSLGSEIGKNASFGNGNGLGMALEDLKNWNFSKNVRNRNVTAEGRVPKDKTIKGEADGPNSNKDVSRKNVEPRKISDNGSKGKKSPQMNDGRNSSGTESSRYNSQVVTTPKSFYSDCDIFHGRWVRDDSKPYYPHGSCPYIDRDFDCHLNKRPDKKFVKWKWQPYGCHIPSLNATNFLTRLRGQKLVFVGDSLNRNMWESLVCILRQSILNKKRVYEISGRREFKKKDFYAFRFEDYNCSVDFVSSPFLVRESSFKGVNGSFETLRLDLMDRTTSMYQDADILVFNTGHWWTHEKTSRGEEYYQEGNHVHHRLKVLEAFKRALATWARWVDKNINGDRTQVIFRGYSETHFSGGQWNSGGQCHKETEPILNETYLSKYPSKMRLLEYVLRKMRNPVIYLNISRLTDFRKDGHPSIYRKEYKTLEEQIAGEQAQDCSHWCLPGVPDTWNELLYASLLKTGRGSWRN